MTSHTTCFRSLGALSSASRLLVVLLSYNYGTYRPMKATLVCAGCGQSYCKYVFSPGLLCAVRLHLRRLRTNRTARFDPALDIIRVQLDRPCCAIVCRWFDVLVMYPRSLKTKQKHRRVPTYPKSKEPPRVRVVLWACVCTIVLAVEVWFGVSSSQSILRQCAVII